MRAMPVRISQVDALADMDRDYIVRGVDAVTYGLVDHVIDRRPLEIGNAMGEISGASMVQSGLAR